MQQCVYGPVWRDMMAYRFFGCSPSNGCLRHPAPSTALLPFVPTPSFAMPALTFLQAARTQDRDTRRG